MKKTMFEIQTFCAGCGKPLLQDAAFCIHCGKARSQQQVPLCSQCGAKLLPDSVFCSQCGIRLERPKMRRPRKKLSRRTVTVLCIVLGLLLVLLIAGIVLWNLSRSWVRDISLSHDQLKVTCFETGQLTCAIYPEAAADRPVSWS